MIEHIQNLLDKLPQGSSVRITQRETVTEYTSPQIPLKTDLEDFEPVLLPKVTFSPPNSGYVVSVGRAIIGVYPTEEKAREEAFKMSGFLAT